MSALPKSVKRRAGRAYDVGGAWAAESEIHKWREKTGQTEISSEISVSDDQASDRQALESDNDGPVAIIDLRHLRPDELLAAAAVFEVYRDDPGTFDPEAISSLAAFATAIASDKT